MRNLGVYWWKGEVNFGDILSRDLLSDYGFKVFHKSVDKLACGHVCCIGSVLGWLPEDFEGFILGSGIMRPADKRFSRATILGLRGEMTRQVIGASQNIVLGDPGLLAGNLVDNDIQKKHLLGVVPHFAHKNSNEIRMLQNRYEDDILVIDVQREPKEVINEIASCEYIISSSLHGIIVADSLGIPAGWFRLENVAGGGHFKFKDYGTAIDDEIFPLQISDRSTLTQMILHTRKTPGKVSEVKGRLDSMFKRLSFSLN